MGLFDMHRGHSIQRVHRYLTGYFGDKVAESCRVFPDHIIMQGTLFATYWWDEVDDVPVFTINPKINQKFVDKWHAEQFVKSEAFIQEERELINGWKKLGILK